MKLLRSILGLLVSAVVLLHILVPHVHYNAASEVATLHTHDCSVNIFNDLQVSLGLSHEAGDFEQFVEFDNSLDNQACPVAYLLPQEYFARQIDEIPVITFKTEAFLDLDRLRGPPAS